MRKKVGPLKDMLKDMLSRRLNCVELHSSSEELISWGGYVEWNGWVNGWGMKCKM
jgi:hypothetical protein